MARPGRRSTSPSASWRPAAGRSSSPPAGRLVVDLLRCGATHIVMPLRRRQCPGPLDQCPPADEADPRASDLHRPYPCAERGLARQEGGPGDRRRLYPHLPQPLSDAETFAELRRNGVLEGAAAGDRRLRDGGRASGDAVIRLPGGRPLVVTPGIDLPRFDPTRVSAERMIQLAQPGACPTGRR